MWLWGGGTLPHGRCRCPILPIPLETLSGTVFSVTRLTANQPAGSGKWWQILWLLGMFADLPLGLGLVKAGLGVQLGPTPMQPSPVEAATNCGSLVALNRLPRATRGQHLALACTSFRQYWSSRQREIPASRH